MTGTSAPTTVSATVAAARPIGAHDVVSLRVPEHPDWARCRPGQFVLTPGDPALGGLRPDRRWVAGVAADPLHGTTVDLVVPAATLDVGERLEVIGPLGRGFSLPAAPVRVLLVGHGAGEVPVHWLMRLLHARGCEVHLVSGADDSELHLDLGQARRHAGSVVLAEPEGLLEASTRVLDDPHCGADLVYGAGAPGVLAPVAREASERGLPSRWAALDLEAEVVCGSGVCGACDLTVGAGDVSAVVRPCLEGPVVAGERWQPAVEARGLRR